MVAIFIQSGGFNYLKLVPIPEPKASRSIKLVVLRASCQHEALNYTSPHYSSS